MPFTIGDLKIFSQSSTSICFSLGDKVSPYYLAFKTLCSIYLIVAYVLSHFEFVWKPQFYLCDKETKNDITNTTENVKNSTVDAKKHLCELDSVWPYYWLYFTSWSFNLFVLSVLFDTSLVCYRFFQEHKNDKQSTTELLRPDEFKVPSVM